MLSRGARAELDRFDPDVVLLGGWNQPAFWTGLRWARKRRRPVVLWVESTARDERSGNPLLERLKRRAVASAAGFLVPGRAAEEYVESLGVPRERIVIAPNAVDLSIFSVEPDRRDRDGCTFLYVGRFSQEKGVDVLLRAFRDVPGRLILAGTGPQEEQVRALADDRVELLGHVAREDLPALYASADCLVLPSRSEAWGMVLNEAAAAGLPLVATEAAGGGYDLIEEGVNGYRVPVEDEAALAAALRKVAADPDWRIAAGERSRELTAGYTGEAWAEQVVRLVRTRALPPARVGEARPDRAADRDPGAVPDPALQRARHDGGRRARGALPRRARPAPPVPGLRARVPLRPARAARDRARSPAAAGSC